ncbi:MAG: hypothetical protein JWQ30_2329 [Sediminibacterium sp.]|nr:hypothetical protein [Sediminibacterium sp.]
MHFKRVVFVFLFFSTALFACTKVDIQFGDQYLDNGYTQVIKVDSFAVDLSTVYVDSFVTSAKGVSMIGAYNDPVFGQITTKSYFEVIPPTYSDPYVADSFKAAIFDSIALVLKPDKSYIGDTTKPIQINVHQLSEPIVPYDNSLLILHNTRSFDVMLKPLGSKTVTVRPNANELITIRLDDNFGKDLLKKYQDPNDADVKNSDAFLQYLYGFRLSTTGASQLIFGCSDSVILRLYYKRQGLYALDRTVDLVLGNKTHQFNQVTVDRSATVLNNLAASKEINSTVTNNTAYTMYAAGAMAKIRFPTIRDVLKLPNYTKILKASLIVRPIRGTYGTGSYTLPPQLRLSTTTQLNQIGNDLTSINSEGSAELQTGDLTVDNLYGENTNYVYDLTQYIRAMLLDATVNANGLLLIPYSPIMETQFNRLVMGNRNNSEGKMELLIIYASVQ